MNLPKPVAIALSAILAGAATGGAVAAFCAWLAWQQYEFMSFLGDGANIVFAGWAIGGIVAFVLCWRLSRAIIETWRRAAMSVTAGIGAAAAGGGGQVIGMASMMSMSPLTAYYLPAYTLLIVAFAVFFFRMARKAAAAPA